MQITQGISKVSLNAMETSEKSQYIQKNVDQVTNQVEIITKAIKEQAAIAEELKDVINIYKI